MPTMGVNQQVRTRHVDVRWAHNYDGYARMAHDPAALERLLVGAREEYRRSGVVPPWCGVDYLKAWAFYLTRADRHAGGGTLNDEWESVLEALRRHARASAADKPPPRTLDDLELPARFSAAPKAHRDSEFLAAKQGRWWEAHVAPINQYVDQIQREVTEDWGDDPERQDRPVFVPYVDPDSGGVLAKVLFLLESPAGPAALGSRMLSADNDDETAKNLWTAYAVTGMPRTWGLHWNAVPWYVGDGKRNAAVTRSDVTEGEQYLDRLLDLTPSLHVILALGRKAQRVVAPMLAHLTPREVTVIHAPHPGPIPAGVTKGRSLTELHEAMREAMRLCESPA